VRLLLDECVDHRLAQELRGHEVHTVARLGWAGIRNGDLLARAAGKFDAFVTVDRNLAFQQHIEGLALGVVILRTKTNRLVDLKPLVPTLLRALSQLRLARWYGSKANGAIETGSLAGLGGLEPYVRRSRCHAA